MSAEEKPMNAMKRYYLKNREKILQYTREYCKNRYHTDPEYKERKNEEARMRHQALKQFNKEIETIFSTQSMG